jgi:hypothetical protein
MNNNDVWHPLKILDLEFISNIAFIYIYHICRATKKFYSLVVFKFDSLGLNHVYIISLSTNIEASIY